MKNFRLFAAALLASVVVTFAPAQAGDDFATLRAKAEKGNGIAQYNLGLAFAEGRGVAVDRLEAFAWLSLAGENGARGRALDSLIASFDKATLAAAQQRLADHRRAAPGKLPLVSTSRADPEVLTTVKTTGASAGEADAASLGQQIASLTADKKQLSEEVAKAWKEIEALNAALSQAEKEVRKSSTQALDQKYQETQTAAEQENAAKFSRELEASLKRLNEQKVSLELNLTAVQAELTRTKTDLASQTQKAARLAAAEAARLTPSAEAAGLRNQLSATQTELKELSAAKAAAVPSYPDLSGRVGELEAAAADAAQKLAAAGSAQSELQRQLAEANQARRDGDALSDRATSLSNENAQLRADQERLQRTLKTETDRQLKAAATDEGRIKELETQTASLQVALGAARAQTSNLQSSLANKKEVPAYPDLSDKVRNLEARLAATNQQADSTVQTAISASKQSTADLNAAAAKIGRLEAALAAKPDAAPAPDLSDRVHELESQLTAASSEANRAKQEMAALSQAQNEAAKNRGPGYPNLAGRVIELQTALADTQHDLSAARSALHAAEQARPDATPAAATVTAAAEPVTTGEQTAVQKQLAETEDKLATALRGYALLQREHDAQIETATKSADTVTAERNTLAAQVGALTAEVEQLKAGSASQSSAAQAEATRAAESLAALQRSTAQNTTDLAAARALLQQVQGAYTVLANENYQLKTRLAPGGATTAGVSPVPPPGAARVHVVAAGDTLSRISQRYYNTPARWQEIYRANAAKLGTTGVLHVGAELVIP